MPTPPAQLFDQHGMTVTGSVPWGKRPLSDDRGVYVVSLHRDLHSAEGFASPPIEDRLVAAWIQTASHLTVNGQPATVATMTRVLREYWLSDEAILYIGKATSLRSRVGSYYRSEIGHRSPHRGGMWLKTLGNLASLWVHYSPTPTADPTKRESEFLRSFMKGVSSDSLDTYPTADQTAPLPFANLEWRSGGRKLVRSHGLKRQTL